MFNNKTKQLIVVAAVIFHSTTAAKNVNGKKKSKSGNRTSAICKHGMYGPAEDMEMGVLLIVVRVHSGAIKFVLLFSLDATTTISLSPI